MSDVPGGPTPPPPPPPPPMMGGPQGGMAPKTLGEILLRRVQHLQSERLQAPPHRGDRGRTLSFISALSSGVVFAGTKHTDHHLRTQVVVVDRSFGLLLAGALVAALISVIITAVLQAAILRAAAQATIGDPVDAEESYRFGFKRLGSVILVSVLVGLAVVGGFILLIIPGIIFLVLFSVSVPVLIVENRRGQAGDEPLLEPGEGSLLARVRRHHRRRAHRRVHLGDHRCDRRQRLGRPVDLHRRSRSYSPRRSPRSSRCCCTWTCARGARRCRPTRSAPSSPQRVRPGSAAPHEGWHPARTGRRPTRAVPPDLGMMP